MTAGGYYARTNRSPVQESFIQYCTCEVDSKAVCEVAFEANIGDLDRWLCERQISEVMV